MDREFQMPELAKREERFFNGTLPSTIVGEMYYTELRWLAEDIRNIVIKLQGLDSKKNIL